MKKIREKHSFVTLKDIARLLKKNNGKGWEISGLKWAWLIKISIVLKKMVEKNLK